MTRIDSFLPFLDLSYKRGGQDVLKPTFSCVTPNPSGSLTAIFGYQQRQRRRDRDPVRHARTRWRATRPASARRGSSRARTLVVRRRLHVGPDRQLDAVAGQQPDHDVERDRSSPRCTAAGPPRPTLVLSCRAIFRSGCSNLELTRPASRATPTTITASSARSPPAASTLLAAYDHCVAGTPPGGANWTCFEGGADATSL